MSRLSLSMILLCVSLFATSPVPTAVTEQAGKVKNLAVIYDLDGDIEKKYNEIIIKKLKEIGFNLTDPHHRVNDQYEKKYGKTVLDLLSFLPVVNDNVVMPLLNQDPRLAGFSPFNMLIYKKKDEKQSHVGHLTPEAMLDILEIKDPDVRKTYIESFQNLDKLLDEELGTEHKRFIPYHNKTNRKMFNFVYKIDKNEEFDMDDFLDEFQNKFELAFIGQNYLIAGFHDFMQTDNGEKDLKDYDAFWTYSLCHLGYSYNVFDTEGARPDAGLFAPCTMYAYIKKDSDELVIGMPTLENVKNTLDIKTPKRVGWIKKLDQEIPAILASMGMVAVENTNPNIAVPKALAVQPLTIAKLLEKEKSKKSDPTEKKDGAKEKGQAPQKEQKEKEQIQKIDTDSEVIEIIIPTPPKTPKPVQLKVNGHRSSDQSDAPANRSIQFSKRMPPNYNPGHHSNESVGNSSALIGDVNSGRISAYLRGNYMDVAQAKEKLEKAGFHVLSAVPLDKKGTLTSVVFTNDTLKEMGAKPKRGFVSDLRLLIDKKNKTISITNPLYTAKAFQQNEFEEQKAKKILTTLNNTFDKLKNSDDALKFQALPKYQFMKGMPQYQDMVVVGEGDKLIEKAQKNKKLLFKENLQNGSTIVGIALSRRTAKFPERIGTNNAAMLPYPVLIEKGKAYILDPKYYISVMYPKLKMSEFMTIATIPDAIVKDCERAFK